MPVNLCSKEREQLVLPEVVNCVSVVYWAYDIHFTNACHIYSEGIR